MLKSDENIFKLASSSGKPLILDGAMGSVLQLKYGSKKDSWVSHLNIENPEAIIQLHRKYIDAGADIITTNTFRTNPPALKSYGLSKKYVAAALEIAKKAKDSSKVLIAGCNPPAEDCYKVERTLSSTELYENHSKHIEYLIDNGCDFILNETFSHMDEIRIVSEFCTKFSIPYIISLYFTDDLSILSGESLKDAINYIINNGAPLAIGFNCIKPETFLKFYKENKFTYNWGAYFNCGSGAVEDENLICSISPEEYGKTMRFILNKEPSFLGACCGSTPEHIRQLKKVLREDALV